MAKEPGERRGRRLGQKNPDTTFDFVCEYVHLYMSQAIAKINYPVISGNA
jgi:hypothetical protein